MLTRKVLALAAFLFLGIGGTGAKADPILTPLLTAALANTALAGGITIGASTLTYASIATYSLKAPK